MKALGIEGAWVYEPQVHGDDRGSFAETFRGTEFAADLGYRLDVAQVNCSVSRRGVIRGIHYADVPPGQAKYVTCVAGAILDVIVDLRTDSPTFGTWEAVPLDAATRRAVFLAEGLGHAFTALTDDATAMYLCSTPYAPGREHGVHPLDPSLAIAWPTEEGWSPVLSEKDAAAPTLDEALRAGQLPRYADCAAHQNMLVAGAIAKTAILSRPHPAHLPGGRPPVPPRVTGAIAKTATISHPQPAHLPGGRPPVPPDVRRRAPHGYRVFSSGDWRPKQRGRGHQWSAPAAFVRQRHDHEGLWALWRQKVFRTAEVFRIMAGRPGGHTW